MTWEDLPDILSASHIADYLQISRRKVYDLQDINPDHGGIPTFRIGASKRVKKKDFEKWLDQQVEANSCGKGR